MIVRLVSITVLLCFLAGAALAFMPGPTLIRECPKCKTPIAEPTMASGNTMGAEFWTDGKMGAPMLPDYPAVVKCPKCKVVFWIEDAKKVGQSGGFYERGSGVQGGEDFLLPTISDYIKKAATEKNRERQLYLRVRAWRDANDKWRGKWGAKPTFSAQDKSNLTTLSSLLNVSNPGQRLMKAEINRELGRFDQSLKLLNYRFDEYMADSASLVKFLAGTKSTAVVQIIGEDGHPRSTEENTQRIKPSDEDSMQFVRAIGANCGPFIRLMMGHHSTSALLDRQSEGNAAALREACRTASASTLGFVLDAAVSEGSLKVTRALLNSGVKVDAKGSAGYPVLISACEAGSEGVARILIEHGADVNTKDWRSRTPLMAAAVKRYTAVARMLLEKGAALDARNEDRNTALMQVCSYWDLDLPKDLTPESHHDKTLEMMKLLISRGADVNAAGHGELGGAADADVTPLIEACVRCDPSMLLPKAKPGKDEFVALVSTRLDTVKLLLDSGADPNKADSKGRTALAYACENGNQDIAELLISRGADVNRGTAGEGLPINIAVEKNKMEILRLLVEKGADVNARGYEGATPVMRATFIMGADAVKVLLDHGAKIDMKDNQGQNLMHNAICSVECVKLALAAGADIDAVDAKGRTPLMLSAEGYGACEAMVPFLLEKGARTDIKDKSGKTALMHAEESRLTYSITALKKWLSQHDGRQK